MNEVWLPEPDELETVAVEGIWSTEPEPSPFIKPSMPRVQAAREFFSSCAETLNSPRSLPSVAFLASQVISLAALMTTGLRAKDFQSEPEPRPIPSPSQVPWVKGAPPCTRNGTRAEARVVPPPSVMFEVGTVLKFFLANE